MLHEFQILSSCTMWINAETSLGFWIFVLFSSQCFSGESFFLMELVFEGRCVNGME